MTMTIQELLRLDPALRALGAMPEMDPLTEVDALQEAQVLDVRFDALTLTVGLLFELRMALQLREANTGVLVARGVRELSWSGPGRAQGLTAWTVGGSVPRPDQGLFRLELGMWPVPGAQLNLLAESAAFFAVDVPGLSEAPPDYTDLDRLGVSAELAGWDSPFEPVHAVFLDAAPAGYGEPSGG
jgi:hypothetical protein